MCVIIYFIQLSNPPVRNGKNISKFMPRLMWSTSNCKFTNNLHTKTICLIYINYPPPHGFNIISHISIEPLHIFAFLDVIFQLAYYS